MKTHELKVEKRDIFGKKLKRLRKQGVMPANIYGKDIESTAVQLPLKEFQEVFKETGETGLVELQFDGKKRPVLIHNVQFDFITSVPVHADFYQVNLKEKIKAMVPVEIMGEPKAVAEKIGLLLQTLNEVEVEALPADLPEHLEVDVTGLAAIDEAVTVANLVKPQGVEILTPADEMIAKITELVSKEAEEQAAAEAAAAEQAAAEGGEAPIEAPEEGAKTPAEAPKEETAPQE